MTKRSDQNIDYSDMPELGDAFWDDAIATPPRNAKAVTLHLPQDVFEFFRTRFPNDYSSRMAAVLAFYVKAQRSRAQSDLSSECD